MEMVSGSMPANDEGSMRLSIDRSYGTSSGAVERRLWMFAHMLVWVVAVLALEPTVAQIPVGGETHPIKMVVLGDSLSAGLGLPASAAFPARLQNALKSKGIDVDMINAGVSGDTSSGGRDRLAWGGRWGAGGVVR